MRGSSFWFGSIALFVASLVGPAHAQPPTPDDDTHCADADTSDTSSPVAIALELHGGFFGLFNLNKSYTDADPSFGATAAIELRVHRYLSIGAEYDVSWIRSSRGRAYRLTMAPQVRARFHVALGSHVTFYVLAAFGLAIWPQDDTEPALDAALRATRLGTSFRVSGGISYALDPAWSIFLGIGYAATATYDAGLTAWVDDVRISLGASVRL